MRCSIPHVRICVLTVFILMGTSVAFGAYEDLIICELMASNEESFADEDNDSPDWIEIFNSGDVTISLKGWSLTETRTQLKNPYVFGAMLVREGLVDGQVHGVAQSYPNAIRPVLQVIPRRKGVDHVAGLYLVILKNRTLLFADATVNMNPDAETLAEIAGLAAEMAVFFDMTPRVAMLSYSNYGSVRNADTRRMARAAALARERHPDLVVDGEMQADTAVTDSILEGEFAFNRLGQAANVLIFPSLAAGNIAYKLMDRLGGAKVVGPLLMGIDRPFNVLQRNAAVESVVDLIAITVAQAQANALKDARG